MRGRRSGPSISKSASRTVPLTLALSRRERGILGVRTPARCWPRCWPAGPRVKRAVYDFAAAEAARDGDREIADLGGEAKMPWESDGRRWHTLDRVGRTGNPCRWDGRILDDVIDRIEQRSDLFSETDWNSRSVVEISAAKKSDGWFFHAITGEEWLLKMKFRTARGVFQRDELIARLDLKPLNDMPELPLYGTEPRTRVRNMRGPWQEIELRVHGYAEIDRPEFWKFVDEAVAGFARFSAARRAARGHPPAVEATGPQVAFRPPRISRRQAGRVGRRGLGGVDRIARRGRRRTGNSSGTTSRSCRCTCPSRRSPGRRCRRRSSTAST